MLAFTLLALSCPTPNAEHILAKNSNGHTVRWEFSSSQVLSIPSAVELGYRNWVRKNTSLSGRELLQNHIQIVEKVYEPQEILKMRKIVAGEIGKFRALNCIEAQAFNRFLTVADLTKERQELFAYIFRKGNRVIFVGDFYRNELGIGTSASTALRVESQRLRRDGWTLDSHLHNHPFSFDNPYGDFGGNLAPSNPDIQTYLRDKVQNAVITNGVETVVFSRREIQALE